MQSIRKISLALATSTLALVAGSAAHAQITTFTSNGSGATQFTRTQGSCCGGPAPVISGSTLLLGNAAGGNDGYTSGTTFYNTLQSITAFTSQFTFASDVPGNAAGFAFVLQNDPAGASAFGSTNKAFGYGSNGYNGQVVNPSAAVFFNDHTQSSGIDTAHSPGGGTATGLDFTKPVQALISYDGVTLTETLTQGGAVPFTTSSAVNLATLFGGNTAYVGFANSADGTASNITVSDFSFSPVLAPEPSAVAGLAFGAFTLVGLVARKRRASAC